LNEWGTTAAHVGRGRKEAVSFVFVFLLWRRSHELLLSTVAAAAAVISSR
jgi:hypothetical protein